MLLQLASVWSFDVFATQDGPVHLLNARVVFDYDNPGQGIFREFYTLSREWNPNWVGQLLLAAFLNVVSIDVAEKLLVSIFVAGLPLAMRSLARACGSSSGLLALAVIPFVQTFPLHMGFYNFCLSLVGFAWLLGQYIRLQSSFHLPRSLVFSLGCVALYFTHIVSTLALFLCIGCLSAIELLHGDRHGNARRALLRRCLVQPLVLLAPCALLVGYFVGSEGGPAPPVFDTAIVDNALRTLLLQFFTSWGEFDLIALAPATGTLGLLLLGTALRERNFETEIPVSPSRALLVASVCFVSLALVMPKHSLAGEFITDRLLLYPVYLAIAWLSLREAAILEVRWVLPVLVGLAVASSAVAWRGQREVNRELAIFHECDRALPSNSFIVPLTFDPRGRWLGIGSPWTRVDPMVHAGSRTALRLDSVSSDNFTAENGNHPLIWQPGYLPRTQIGCTFCMPPSKLDLSNYPRSVDAVLAWKAPASVPDPLGAQLRGGFEEVCRSKAGEIRVWLPRQPRP